MPVSAAATLQIPLFEVSIADSGITASIVSAVVPLMVPVDPYRNPHQPPRRLDASSQAPPNT